MIDYIIDEIRDSFQRRWHFFKLRCRAKTLCRTGLHKYQEIITTLKNDKKIGSWKICVGCGKQKIKGKFPNVDLDIRDYVEFSDDKLREVEEYD
jgi:superfamily II helicase